MSYESFYWRKIIKREVTYLGKKLLLSHKDVENDLDAHYSNLEIKIMTLAYVARKMADSNKLPDSTLHKEIKLLIHPRTNSPRRPFVDIEREYDLDATSEATLEFREICNQIIHSYVMEPFGTSRRAFRYLWFVSDRQKDIGLYQIDLKIFMQLMLEVAGSYVSGIVGHYDKDRGEWKYVKS